MLLIKKKNKEHTTKLNFYFTQISNSHFENNFVKAQKITLLVLCRFRLLDFSLFDLH